MILNRFKKKKSNFRDSAEAKVENIPEYWAKLGVMDIKTQRIKTKDK